MRLAKVVSIFKLNANEQSAFANRPASAPPARRVEPVAMPKKPKTAVKSLPAAKPAPKRDAPAKANDDDWEEI